MKPCFETVRLPAKPISKPFSCYWNLFLNHSVVNETFGRQRNQNRSVSKEAIYYGKMVLVFGNIEVSAPGKRIGPIFSSPTSHLARDIKHQDISWENCQPLQFPLNQFRTRFIRKLARLFGWNVDIYWRCLTDFFSKSGKNNVKNPNDAPGEKSSSRCYHQTAASTMRRACLIRSDSGSKTKKSVNKTDFRIVVWDLKTLAVDDLKPLLKPFGCQETNRGTYMLSMKPFLKSSVANETVLKPFRCQSNRFETLRVLLKPYLKLFRCHWIAKTFRYRSVANGTVPETAWLPWPRFWNRSDANEAEFETAWLWLKPILNRLLIKKPVRLSMKPFNEADRSQKKPILRAFGCVLETDFGQFGCS